MLPLLASLALAACPAPTTTAHLSQAISAAESAYAQMDLDAFKAARASADSTLECLGETMTPPDAAAYHRLVGLDAYIAHDSVRTFAAFRAATTLQPAYTLPASLAPPGNPLEAAYQDARSASAPTARSIVAPPGTLAYVDGTRTTLRPADCPTLLQLVASTGEVLWSGYLLPRAADPDWTDFGLPARAAPAPVALAGVAVPARKRSSPTLPLALGAGGAALASGVIYALALSSRAEFDDPETHQEDLAALRARTNGLVYGASGVGVVAVGLGAVAVISVAW